MTADTPAGDVGAGEAIGWVLHCGLTGTVLIENTPPEAAALIQHDDDTVCALVPQPVYDRLVAAVAEIRRLHAPITVTEGHDCNELEQYGRECDYKIENPPHDVTICGICRYEGRDDAHYPCATVAALAGQGAEGEVAGG